MKHINSFKNELEKIAIPFGAMADVGLGLLGVKGAAQSSFGAGKNLGLKWSPMKLKPSSNYTFNSGQYSEKVV
jgi:hypothetical protein